MNRHDHKPAILTGHLSRAMLIAQHMPPRPDSEAAKAWAADMRAHFRECAAIERNTMTPSKGGGR